MPTAKVFNLIDDSISIMTTSQCSFTAYDITQMVREQTDEEFLHDEVKQYIHDSIRPLVLGGSYTKDKDSQHNAIRYNPVISNTDNTDSIDNTNIFNNLNLRDLPNIIGRCIKKIKNNLKNDIVIEEEATKTVTENKTSLFLKINKKRDRRNRLCIPKEITTYARFQPYQVVYLVIDTLESSVVITRKPFKSDKVITSLSVDKSSNIRLSPKTLKKTGISINDSIALQVIPNNILIHVL